MRKLGILKVVDFGGDSSVVRLRDIILDAVQESSSYQEMLAIPSKEN